MGTSPLGRVAAGALAGVAGTLAMDLVWYRRARRDGNDQSFVDWELAASSSFEDASAPAEVAQRVTGTAGVELPDEAAGATTNVVHWLTGIGYGVAHALLQHRRGVLRGGIATGLGAFAASYVGLGAMGIYQPIWEYDRETLQQDLTAHLAFGLATGLVYAASTDRDDGADGHD
ncbi:MAG: hypothetical protein KY461_06835 [Actinobacteria bacterium]|nr:hypothetical protein [Actinomycetota bacterium]